MGRVWRLPGGAQRAILSTILTFFAREIANFRSPAGASLGSEGSQGIPRGPSRKEGLDFPSKGVKFPGKFPDLCFAQTPQISRIFSGNLRLAQHAALHPVTSHTVQTQVP